MSDKFLNVEEARKLLRVSRVTLYRWITDGKLRANKVGGTYRIKQSDVDALIEGVPSTQSRDGEAGGRAPSRSPLDVTARDIEKWSEDNRLAQENLPELVRWLAQSASSAAGIDDLHIPSGDSVGKPGWDGMIKSNSGDRFIPAGTSAWEMGVGPSEAKAEKDFNKRTANPQNVEIKDTTFVFVTPKIWSNSNSWVKEKASSGWKNIKVIDADDLADWLEVSPAVKIKFLSRIGRNTKNLQDVETYWSEWSGETTPNFSTDLAISGRNESNKKLIDLVLRDKTKKLVTVAAGSKAEAVAFIVASMISCDEIDQALLLSNTLVVSSQEAWDEIIRTE
ncbi:helix-turn-helix domain-containing protein, partial [Candidatus Saccharibacteria bacterium]|nr:helix-turn-helix domain-containing protein [Candidatus Saccharibacteria bacterium]